MPGMHQPSHPSEESIVTFESFAALCCHIAVTVAAVVFIFWMQNNWG
jgi:hypothetical protein